MDVVIVTPEKGRHKEIGQKLLALADHPHQVQWVTWPQAGFSVPLELFAKFDADGEDGAAPAAEESTPPKRRRRNKEVVHEDIFLDPVSISMDNTTSEEE